MSAPAPNDHERLGVEIARILLDAAREQIKREREAAKQAAQVPEPPSAKSGAA